jgi:hypothetical protein
MGRVENLLFSSRLTIKVWCEEAGEKGSMGAGDPSPASKERMLALFPMGRGFRPSSITAAWEPPQHYVGLGMLRTHAGIQSTDA